MFVGITNTPRDYAWGSRTAIAELLGTAPSGHPEAELWLGSHPGSPSRTATGTLAEITSLPFLLKVLAAASPLSLQVHPNAAQAAAGFARENAAGIPVDAPDRNYRDPYAKPELIYALSDSFRAMCGFRSAVTTLEVLAPLADVAAIAPLIDRLVDDSSLPRVFEWLLRNGEGVPEIVAALVAHARSVGAGVEASWDTVRWLAQSYPNDPGVAISLLLNTVTMAPGDVLYLGAGTIHAYLEGLGIELMTGSDNVLRGGLTPKHIDIAQVLAVLDFTPAAPTILRGTALGRGVVAFVPEGAPFRLVRIESDSTLDLTGEAIALCVGGEFAISGKSSSTTLRRGESTYISADEYALDLVGHGELFVATV